MTPGDPILLAALLLFDAVLGRPEPFARLWPDGVPGIAWLVGQGVRRLDRAHRGPADRSRRGAVTAIAAAALGAAGGWVIARLVAGLPVGFLVEAWVLLWAIDLRRAVSALRTVADGLESTGGDPVPVRRALAQFGIEAAAIDDRHGLARAVVEGAAVRVTAMLCGPVLAYLAFGLPGVGVLLALRTALAAAQRRGSVPFVAGTAFVLDLALWLPSLLAAVLLAAGAVFAPGARPERTLASALPEAWAMRSRTVAIAALAAAYEMALIGPRPAGPVALPDGRWVGGGTARLESGHVRRAAALLALAVLLQFMLVLVLIAAR